HEPRRGARLLRGDGRERGWCHALRLRPILDFHEVPDVRLRADLVEHEVMTLARTHPGHATFGIVEVPEDNGVGRAHLLTRRLDVTVGDRAAFLFGEQLAVLDRWMHMLHFSITPR